MSSSLAQFRARLLAIASIAMIIPLTSTATADDPSDTGYDPGDTGFDPETGYVTHIVCEDAVDDICPVAAGAADFVTIPGRCEVISIPEEATLQDGQCCYPVEMSCTREKQFEHCGCYGRPFVLEGRPVQAAAARTESWAPRSRRPRLSALSPADRAQLARFWTDNGLAEHSSVAGFARFVLDLIAHGAPAELVRRAQIAGMEETAHAEACFALASAYVGEPVGPAPLPMHGAAPVAKTLIELAVKTAHEGAIGETLSAYLAGEMLARATDPEVRKVLSRIVRDEARHAELAWATLSWAVTEADRRGEGEEMRAALILAFANPEPNLGGESADPRLEAHGLVSVEVLNACMSEGLEALVRPAAAALLGLSEERCAA